MPQFTCDYGYNIHLGRNVFINYHGIFSTVLSSTSGMTLQVGLLCSLRRSIRSGRCETVGLESARPIRIGNDVWIGGGAVILPGVTIGDRSGGCRAA